MLRRLVEAGKVRPGARASPQRGISTSERDRAASINACLHD
jgi:hypothetical protein